MKALAIAVMGLSMAATMQVSAQQTETTMPEFASIPGGIFEDADDPG